jgi:hypothetical protein
MAKKTPSHDVEDNDGMCTPGAEIQSLKARLRKKI